MISRVESADRLSTACAPIQKARLLALKDDVGGLWLTEHRKWEVVPSKEAWQTAFKVRLGLPLLDTRQGRQCRMFNTQAG